MNNPDAIALKEQEEARRQQKKRSSELKTKWRREHYDTIVVLIPKGEKEKFLAAVNETDFTISGFVVDAINVAHPGLLTPLDEPRGKKKPEQPAQPEEAKKPSPEPSEATQEPSRKAGRPFGAKDRKQRTRRTKEEIARDKELAALAQEEKRPRGRPPKETKDKNPEESGR